MPGVTKARKGHAKRDSVTGRFLDGRSTTTVNAGLSLAAVETGNRPGVSNEEYEALQMEVVSILRTNQVCGCFC